MQCVMDDLFEKVTKNIREELGDNYTREVPLQNWGRRRLGPRFLGVFAQDEFDDVRLRPNTCLVANNKPRAQGGEHWVAVTCDDEGVEREWDSFNRVDVLGEGFPSAQNGDADQVISEDDCGPRCLAYLSIWSISPALANKI